MAVRKRKLFCPQCGGTDIIRKGFRDQKSGKTVQRLQCKECKYKFTLGAFRRGLVPHMHQTGRTTIAIDRPRRAKRPGRRVSKEGGIYWEFRRNRSDINPLKGL
jgi:transposase-like protein